jgi:hypothetical protein
MKDLRTPPRAGALTGRRDVVVFAVGRAAVLLFAFFATAGFAARFLAFFTVFGLLARARALPVVLLFFRAAMRVLCDFSTAGTY